MKIIAHGSAGVGAAIAIAETALVAGVQSVTIERAPAGVISVISPSTLTFCPVTDCRECEASPCPFERLHDDKLALAQAFYAEAAHNMKLAEDNLRAVSLHG